MELFLSLLLPAISFCLCLVTANYLSKTTYFAFLLARPNRYKSIDGIRGFLALSVFFSHFMATYYWITANKWTAPPQDIFNNFGKLGVAVFFMITGFLFISKISETGKVINWFTLYKSRVFRILPLYLFALSIISVIVFAHSNFQLKVPLSTLLLQYIKWGMFIGGPLNDVAHAKLIIAGVEWTLKYEWLFYVSLPAVALLLKKINKIGVVILTALSIYLFIVPTFHHSLQYIIYFVVGGLSSYLVNRSKFSLEVRGKGYSAINLMLIVSAVLYPNTLDLFHLGIISSAFVLTLLGNDLFGLFSLRASIVLGEISYSIYLLHGTVLYVVFTLIKPIELNEYTINQFMFFMPVIAVLVVLVSATTYLLIEKPSVDFGRSIGIKGVREE